MRVSKFHLLLLVLSGYLFTTGNLRAQTFYGTTDLKTFREGRDGEFRNREKSPLRDEDFSNYKGLFYFPVKKNLRLRATFSKTAGEKYFLMPTSSGKTKKYIKYAVLDFEIEKQKLNLEVYRADEETREKYPEYRDLLFIPFKDQTNGRETYGGGRYLYLRDTEKDRVTLDFNLASNPSCAYGSDRFSCPIPPRANHLKIEIKAGEKIYPYSK